MMYTMSENKVTTRYSGDVRIQLKFLDWDGLKPRFKVRITAPSGTKWEYDQLRGPAVEDQELTPEIFNQVAAGAVAWAARYHSTSPEARPDWAPPVEFADELTENLDFGAEGGYCISKEPWGDTLFDGGA
jgi:hypothetical protein